MKKRWIALAASVALIGCAENTSGLRIDGGTQNVWFADNVLASRLIIDDIATTEVDGYARGVVRLTSNYKGDQNVQYRFYWYDEEGLEVNTKLAPWKPAIIRGHESIAISEVSINPNGKNFRVQIRELKQ